MGCLLVLSGMMLFSFSASPAHANVTVTISGESGCAMLEGGLPVVGQTNWNPSTNTCTVDDDIQPEIDVGSGNGGGNGETWTIEAGFTVVLTDDVYFSVADYSTLINYGTITGGSNNVVNVYTGSFVDNYGTLDGGVILGGTFINSGTVTLSGSEFFNGGGTLDNSGNINVQSSGILNNTAYLSGNAAEITIDEGTLDNLAGGTISVDSSSELFNQDYLVNDGTITVSGQFVNTLVSSTLGVEVVPGVCFCQYGPFVFGEVLNENTGVVNIDGNSGSLTNNLGFIDNNNGAQIDVNNVLTNENEGNITNNGGTITVGPSGNFYNAYNLFNDAGGTVVNNGEMENAPNYNVYPVEDFTIHAAVGFVNSGTFVNGGDFHNYQSIMQDTGTVTNTGDFDNEGQLGSGQINISGQFTNSGTFTVPVGTFTIQLTSTFVNSGTITNDGFFEITNINGGTGLLRNSGNVNTIGVGTIVGYTYSIINTCSGSVTGNQPPAGAILHEPCAPSITTSSGIVSLAGGLTVSGTDNLASNGGNPVYVFVSEGCFLCNDYLAYTQTSNTGAWSVFVPFSQSTYTLFAVAETCPGGVNGCYGSEYGSSESNTITATADSNLDQQTCTSALGAAWSGSTCTLSASFAMPSGDTLQIGSGATLSLSSGTTFTNSGTLTVSGTITGAGSLANHAGGSVSDSGTITSTGAITNAGTFTVTLDAATCQSYPLLGSWTVESPFSTCTVSSGTSDTILSGMTLDISNGQILYNAGAITDSGAIDLTSAAFYDNACSGTITGNPVSGGTVQYAPCAPTITTPSGVSLTSSLSISGTSNLASNGGAAMTITLYASGGAEVGSATTGSGGVWTVEANPSPGALTLYAVATSSADINSPPSTEIAVVYQLLNQVSCGSPLGGVWSSTTCTVGGSFTLTSAGAIYIPAGTTLAVSGSGSFTNNGAIDNLGTIANGASFTNEFVLVGGSPSYGLLTVSGAITNTGTFLNLGQIVVTSTGSIGNAAQFTNGFTRVNSINIAGEVTLDAGSTLTNSAGATMTDQQDSFFEGAGSITNDGAISFAEGAYFEPDGPFTNAGSLTSTSADIAIVGQASNTGTITATTSGGQLDQINVDNSGSLSNSGTITLTNVGEIYVDTSASLTNQAGGTINNQFGFIVVGTFTNDGTLSQTINPDAGVSPPSDFAGTLEVAGIVTNQGSLTNGVGAVVEVDSGGSLDSYGSISNPGSFTNAGTVNEYCGSSFSGNAITGTAPVVQGNCPVTLALSSQTGLPGTTITLSGGGYGAGVTDYYCLSTSRSNAGCLEASPSQFTSSAGGAIPSGTSLMVPYGSLPMGTPGGAYYVLVFSGQTVLSSASFTVAELYPSLSVSPQNGEVGTAITLSGSEYLPQQTYSFCLSTSSTSNAGCVDTVPGSFTTGSGGTVPGTAVETVPSGTTEGSYFVIVFSGQTVLSSADFFVATPLATLSVAPQTGIPGTTVTLSGNGYNAGSSYSFCLSTTSASNAGCLEDPPSQFTSSDGTIPSGTSLQVPYGSLPLGTPGGGYYVLVFSGQTVVSYAPFTVAELFPTLSLSTQTGPPGTATTLTGSEYVPLQTYSYCLSTSATSNSGCVDASPGSLTTDDVGNIQAGAVETVPQSTVSGPYYVIVFSGQTVVSEASFTVFPPPQPTLSVSPSTGLPGTVITLSGASYTPLGSYSYCLSTSYASNSGCLEQTPLDFTAQTGGIIPSGTTIQVPYGSLPMGTPGGSYFVLVFSGQTIENYASFTVAEFYPSLSLSSSAGLPGSSTTLSGAQYLPLQTYSYCLSTSSSSNSGCLEPTLMQFTAQTDGTIPSGTSIQVPYGSLPYGTPGGGYDVLVFSGTYVVSFAAFEVNELAPSLTATPPSGLPGSSTTLSGSQYLPLQTYSYCLATSYASNSDCLEQTPLQFTAQTDGTIPSGTSLQIPYGSLPLGTSGGFYFVMVFSGQSIVQFTSFNVAELQPTLSLSSQSGPPGTAITLGGAEYLPGASYAYCLSTSATSNFGCIDAFPSDFTAVGPGLIPTGVVEDVPQNAAAGSYYVIVFAGQTVVTSAPFAVVQTQTTLSVAPYDASTGLPWSGAEVTGASAYDQALLGGTTGPAPAGTVTYTFFENPSCGGTAATTGTVSVSGTVPHSASTAPLAAGSYSFSASYSGDPNYLASTSPCEAFTVSVAAPSVATTVYDGLTNAPWSGTEFAGASAYDTSTVTGVPGFVPTGTVTYQLFGDGVCSGAPVQFWTPESLASGVAPPSFPSPTLLAGSYSFNAIYSGDSNYAGATSPCEQISVLPATVSMSTLVSGSGKVIWGNPATDTATVSGGFDPTGSVTFTVYSNSACTTSVFSSAETLSSGGATSGSFTPTAPGTFYWGVTYSGDANNNGLSAPCGPSGETLTATQRATSTTLVCSPSTVVVDVATTCLATVTDTSPGTPVTPTGTVTFTTDNTGTFSSTTCSLSGGSCSVTYTPAPGHEGIHHIGASYGGDVDHSASSAAAFALTATGRTTQTTLFCLPTTVAVNSQTFCDVNVTDTGSGAVSTPGGTVTFSSSNTGTFAPADTCSLVQIWPGTATCSLLEAYTPSPGHEGAHNILATYGGDAYHAPSASTPVTLTATQRATVSSVVCTGPVEAGRASTCTATVTDFDLGTPLAPTGTVGFTTTGSGKFGTDSCTTSGASLVCEATYTQSPVGIATVRASYSGDTDHFGSSATATVGVFDFAVTLTSSSPTVAQGGSTAAVVAVSAVPGSPSFGLPSVSLSLAGLPTGVTATGFPSTLAIGSSATFTLQSSYSSYTNCPQVSSRGGQNLHAADLAGCNLAGYDLAGDNLVNADLKGADLARAGLQGADLAGANLADANTLGTNLQGANLANVDLSGTTIGAFTLTATGTVSGVSHSGSLGFSQAGDNLSGDNLQGADLAGANLAGDLAVGATLQGDNLAGDNLQGGDFQNANFQGANLAGANLSYGNFSYVTFQGADLASSNMSYSDFNYSNFQGSNTHGANIVGATFVGATDAP